MCTKRVRGACARYCGAIEEFTFWSDGRNAKVWGAFHTVQFYVQSVH